MYIYWIYIDIGYQLPYRLRRERTSLMWLPAVEPGERCVEYASSILVRPTGEAIHIHILNLSFLVLCSLAPLKMK